MSDKCRNVSCIKNMQCKRFTAKASDFQSYFLVVPENNSLVDFKCDFYEPNIYSK